MHCGVLNLTTYPLLFDTLTGVYPSLWESLRDVHYNYVTVIFVVISFVDIVIGPIFTETVFTLTQEFLRHGLLTLPYPWPNLPILFMLHFLAISIVGIWYMAASLLYFLLTFKVGFGSIDKPRYVHRNRFTYLRYCRTVEAFQQSFFGIPKKVFPYQLISFLLYLDPRSSPSASCSCCTCSLCSAVSFSCTTRSRSSLPSCISCSL
jgi:hypothetical protein